VDVQRLYFAGHKKVLVSRTECQAFIACTKVKSRQTTDARRISFRTIKILMWNVTEHSLKRGLLHEIKIRSKAEKGVWFCYDSNMVNISYLSNKYSKFLNVSPFYCRSQWPRGLGRRSAAARLLRSWVRIPPVVWMFVCCECCVLLGRGLCDVLITRPEESYRL
jgi:hypothetical protein